MVSDVDLILSGKPIRCLFESDDDKKNNIKDVYSNCSELFDVTELTDDGSFTVNVKPGSFISVKLEGDEIFVSNVNHKLEQSFKSDELSLITDAIKQLKETLEVFD